MMPTQTLPSLGDLPPAIELDAYTRAFVLAVENTHPDSPAVYFAEHLHEVDADGPTVVCSLAALNIAPEPRSGPWLEAMATIECLCLTNRGQADEGLYGCHALVNNTIALMHEARWGLGVAVDPAMFLGAAPDPLGANSDNFYAWRVSCAQRMRLAAPLSVLDDVGLIIDVSVVNEVWLGFDPDIGRSHIDDYILVAKRNEET